jgi:hypothetical protein
MTFNNNGCGGGFFRQFGDNCGHRWATRRLSRTGRGSFLAPIFTRRDRIRVGPQTAAFLAGLSLSVGQNALVLSYAT